MVGGGTHPQGPLYPSTQQDPHKMGEFLAKRHQKGVRSRQERCQVCACLSSRSAAEPQPNLNRKERKAAEAQPNFEPQRTQRMQRGNRGILEIQEMQNLSQNDRFREMALQATRIFGSWWWLYFSLNRSRPTFELCSTIAFGDHKQSNGLFIPAPPCLSTWV